MTNAEITEKIIGSSIHNPLYGDGIVTNIIISSSGKYYISIQFKNKQKKTGILNNMYSKGFLVSEDVKINEYFELLLKRKPLLSSSELNNNINTIEIENVINSLIESVINNELIAIKLISYYDNPVFEIELCSKAFKYLDEILHKYQIDNNQKACIAVALSYIAMKYYDGDLHSFIENKYREYMFNDKLYTKNNIQHAIKIVLSDFRKITCYFDTNSYVAVPIVMCCVPHYRVKDLFRISYDIYKKKLLFDEDISDDQIIEKVKETFHALRRKDLISASDNIKGTNYLMSKYTQSCIYSGYGLESLSTIVSHCIRLIISHLTRPEDSFIIEPYYNEGYSSWVQNFETDNKERERYEKSRTSSRPYLRLSNDEIHLITGEFSMDESYDPNEVHIKVFNGDKVVIDKPIDDPNAITFKGDDYAMSSYIIARQDILIDASPLDSLAYRIYCNDSLLYDSKKRLHRSNLFFDGKGNEIKPGCNYSGEAFVLTHKSNKDEYGENIKEILKKDGYIISSVEINNTEVFYFDNEPYIFFKVSTSKIIGYATPWCVFSTVEGKVFPIYNDITILFPASCDKEFIDVIIDDQNISNDLNTNISFKINIYSKEYGDTWIYTIQIYDLEPGFHNLRLYNAQSNKLIKGANLNLIYDPDLTKHFIEESSIAISFDIISNLTDEQQITYEYGVSQKSIHAFVKNLGHGSLIIYPTNISYSLDGKKWFDINTPICLYDIPESITYIYICGPYDMSAYYSDFDMPLKKSYLNMKCENHDVPNIYKLYLSYIRSIYGKGIGRIYFEFGNRSKYAKIRFTPYIDKDNCIFYYDEKTKKHIFKFIFEGTSTIKAMITSCGFNNVLSEKVISSGDTIEIPDSDIEKKVRSLNISLHGKKYGSLFEQYQKEAFMYFKYDLKKPFVRLFPFPPNVTIANYIFKCKLVFKGSKKLKVEITPTGFSSPLYSSEVHSGDSISFDVSLYAFNSYTLLLYGTSSYEENTFLCEPFFVSKPIKTESSFLRKTLKIESFIYDDGSIKSNKYSIRFKSIEEINHKYYLTAELIDKTNQIIMNNLIVFITKNKKYSYELAIYNQKDGKLKRLHQKDGKKIVGAIIQKLEGSFWKT
ncbi:hypothetical protein [Ruminococcus sp.]|uniref:hypothetical protein n=1 Tax=Ruminococcus sp. TaxID=41978 RepID=UPI0025CFCF2E|nr:hypothetical protein [Ruminococcus sp.]